MADRDYETYAQVKERLDQIVDAVNDDNLPLDDALSLYEEAVTLGLRASDLLEADIQANEAAEAAAEDAGADNSNATPADSDAAQARQSAPQSSGAAN